MDKGVLSFKAVSPDMDIVNEVFKLDVKNISHIDGAKVSEYMSAMTQYLIYFKSQQNEGKAEAFKLQRQMDLSTTQLLTSDIIKQYKTKADARMYLIANTKELSDLEDRIENTKVELMLIDGIDKTIHEYIAIFKRELTRRENELWETRMERK
jgi:hypothetical protein